MNKSKRPNPVIDIGPIEDEVQLQKKAEFNKLRLLAALAPIAWFFIALQFGIASDMGSPPPVSIWVKTALMATGLGSLVIFGQALGHAWIWHIVFFWIWPMVLFSIILLLLNVPTP